MRVLTKGGNALLATSGNVGTSSGTVRIDLHWNSSPCEIDTLCFVVDNNDKVLSDEWFLFYNQPQSPGLAVGLAQIDSKKTEFSIYLDALPKQVAKCIFAVTLGGLGTFREVKDLTITAISPSGNSLVFRIDNILDERALILAEVYQHSSGWKMRAVGQGFKGGLGPLARHYGVDIADDEDTSEPPPPPPQPSPPALSSNEVPPPLQDTSPLSDLPAPDRPDSRPTRRRGSGLKKLLWAVFILALAAGVVLIFYPSLLPMPLPQPLQQWVNRIKPQHKHIQGNGMPVDSEQCKLSQNEILQRYHTLGESYLKVRKIVNDSNRKRARLTQDWRESGFQCDQAFSEKNNTEINRLKELSLQTHAEETNLLNICAGVLIADIEANLRAETRPALIQRLMQNADISRNLESDLTNIARDLAYFSNKADRLIEEYQSNREACR